MAGWGRALSLWFLVLLSFEKKESELCYFPTSSTSCTSLNLYNATGSPWLVCLFLLWGHGRCLEKRVEIQEDSERSKEESFCCCPFQTGAFLLCFWFVWLCRVSYFIGEYSPRAVCQPRNLESFFNANFPSWAAIASWSVKGSDVATEHHSFATVLLSCDSFTKKA